MSGTTAPREFVAPAFPTYTAFYLPLVAYLALHAGLRLAASASLQHDEAEQPVFSQALAWGYSGQPPLYTWLFWALTQVTGTNLVTLTVLKSAILGLLYLFVFLSGRILLQDDRRAALATGSLLLVPMFAWEFLRDYTHTPLMCALAAVTVYVLLRLERSGRRADYLLLGLALGLGVLAKYNYTLFAAAALAAGLATPALRARLLHPRIALTLALAALVVAPHGLWVWANWDLVHGFLARRTGAGMVPSYGRGVLQGCGSLAYNTFLFLTPLWLVGLICFPGGWRPGRRAPAGARFVSALILAVFALLLLLVGACRLTRFYVHWFDPFLMFLPVYFFGRLAPIDLTPGRVRRFTRAVLAASALVAGARWAEFGLGINASKYGHRDRLFQEQVQRLREAGCEDGTIVAGDHVIAGNLRRYFPRARILCASYPAFLPPAGSANGPVVAVWNATLLPEPQPDFVAYVHRVLGLELTAETPADQVGVAAAVPCRHMNRLAFALLRPAGDANTVASAPPDGRRVPGLLCVTAAVPAAESPH